MSTRQQSTDRQQIDILSAGVRRDDLYVDHGISGAQASRPQFDRTLDALHDGDTLVITTLDRLGRSTQNMLAFAEELRGRGAGLRVLNLSGGDVDTATPMGSMLFTIMAALGQIEHEIKRERVIDSINKRRKAGKDLGGRPRIITDSQIRNARRLSDGGEPVTTVDRDLGMTRATFYRRARALDLAGESSEASTTRNRPPFTGYFLGRDLRDDPSHGIAISPRMEGALPVTTRGMDKGTPGTQRHQRWATAVQKCLPPSVKTTAANGQSDIPTPVSLELPLTQERARIAREMHDIVAHSLAVIVTQAQSGELVAGKSPERAATVLGTIAATGRVALADMRRLLGMLRAEGSESSGSGPQPSLADLPQLLNRVGATGLTVRRTDEGTARPVGSAVELTPFRLVQESLTNTLRHAGPGARADLRLAWNARELIVTVSDNGVARWHPAMPPGTG